MTTTKNSFTHIGDAKYVLIGWHNNRYMKAPEFYYSGEPFITTQYITEAKQMSLTTALEVKEQLKNEYQWYALCLS